MRTASRTLKHLTLILALLALGVRPSFAYDGKTSFPLIIKMDSAGINGDVAAAIGGFVFPENKDMVKPLAAWAATLRGADVHVTLNAKDGALTFSPNDLMDAITLKGLKTLHVRASDVTDIYDVSSGWNHFRSVILVTNSGVLLFHLDGESLDWSVADFQKARVDFPDVLARSCPKAVLHRVTCQDDRCGKG